MPDFYPLLTNGFLDLFNQSISEVPKFYKFFSGLRGKVLYPLAEDVLKRAFPTCSKILVFDHIARHHARYDKEKNEGEVSWQQVSKRVMEETLTCFFQLHLMEKCVCVVHVNKPMWVFP